MTEQAVPFVRVALAQTNPVRHALTNSQRLCALIHAHADVAVLIAPELAITGLPTYQPRELAIGPEDPSLAAIAQACADTRTAFIGGYIEDGSGQLHNSMVVIDSSGTVIANYRKTHLYSVENGAFEPGDELQVVEVAGIRLGLMICFDMEFPEVARCLTLMGAEVLVAIAANMDPLYNDQLIASQARALDNRLPLVYVNRVGIEDGVRYNGGSRVVDGDGQILAEAGPFETVLPVTVPLGSVMGPVLHYPTLRRPELYDHVNDTAATM